MAENVEQADAVQRTLALPPGWPLTGMIVIASGFTLWVLSIPGRLDIFTSTMTIVGWIALAVLWLLRLIVYLSRNRIWFPARGHRLRWCVIPLIVGVTAALTFWSVPLYLRFNLGKAELERFAQEVVSEGPRNVYPRGRIGTYEISPWSVDRVGQGGMRFSIDGRVGGLAYSPDRALERSAYYHLQGSWYVWIPRFD